MIKKLFTTINILFFISSQVFASVTLSGCTISGFDSESLTTPIIFFSDLTSGPKTGGENNKGIYVTIWGKNFGSSQGTSVVTIGGGAVDNYPTWGTDAGNGLDVVCFQLGANAVTGNIVVTTNAGASNGIPFTVRTGNIYYCKTTGNDSTGNGSWETPWQTWIGSRWEMIAGDTLYFGDGVWQTTEDSYGSAFNLYANGTVAEPIAVVAYPGASCGINGVWRGIGGWRGGIWPNQYAEGWTFSKLQILNTTENYLLAGSRYVGCYFNAPTTTGGQTGQLVTISTDNKCYFGTIYGCEFDTIGTNAAVEKLYHVIYITSGRSNGASRFVDSGPFYVGWNYFHDCTANRAINIYSEQTNAGYINNITINDNLIENQEGDGILISRYASGTINVYNNIIIGAGQGNHLNDNNTSHVGMNLLPGNDSTREGEDIGDPVTIINVYNNTLYEQSDGDNFDDGAWTIEESWSDTIIWNIKNNITYQSNGSPYLFVGSDTPSVGVFSNNCWYGTGNGPAWDASPINLDPVFVDTSSNYRLQITSPARNAGLDTTDIVTRDYDGNTRPQEASVDIGAYEYIP